MPTASSLLDLTMCMLLILLATVSGCQAPATPSRAPVTLQLDWVHAAQFIGFYVAQTRGYYAREGLDVAILPRDRLPTGTSIPEQVVRGKVDFALGSVSLLEAQLQGAPLTAVAAVLQRNPQVIFARANSGIRRPRDLAGRRVGIKNEAWRLVIARVMEADGASIEDVIEVPVGFDMQPFFDGQVDVWTGYVPDEPVRARLRGLDITTIYAYEYGVDGYAEIIYCRHDLVEHRPDLVERFLRASLDGWREVVRGPEVAVDLMMKAYPELVDRAFQLAAVEALIPLVYTGQQPIGWIERRRWIATYPGGLRPNALPRDSLDPSFVQRIYGKDSH